MAKDTTQADIEALQRAEGEAYDALLTAFIQKRVAAGAVEIQMTEIIGANLTNGAYLTPFAWPDAAGNLFEGVLLNNPNEYSEQAVTWVRYVTPDRATVLSEAIFHGDNKKGDGMTGIQLGTALDVYQSGHELISGPRRNGVDHATWEVGAVPYADGVRPKTGAHAAATEQVFADVPPEHPMYAYIQHMASVGAIGGYPCGGAMEPCDPQQRPYFRPGQTATRGQIAKMIAVATGFVP